jgi:cell division protein FtsI/penicillin-binding protein 2
VEVFRRAGFDSPSKLVAHEARGRIRLPSDSDSLRLEALGYRGIEVTPLELLQAYRRLAIRRGSSGIDADASVFQGLENSIAIGMARTAGVDGMKMAGKTGTAPTRNAKYSHGFFAGFAPAEKPEIAFMVFLEQGRGADAAAVAQPVLEAYARRRNTQ